jgi:hypothetical protein
MARVGGEDFYRFGGINRAAAAEGDKVIAPGLPIRRVALLHQRFGGLGTPRQTDGKTSAVHPAANRLSSSPSFTSWPSVTISALPLFTRYQLDHIADCARAVEADFGQCQHKTHDNSP